MTKEQIEPLRQLVIVELERITGTIEPHIETIRILNGIDKIIEANASDTNYVMELKKAKQALKDKYGKFIHIDNVSRLIGNYRDRKWDSGRISYGQRN
jgi:hypothetical protein